MTADLYCSRSDVSKRLPPGSLVSTSSLIDSSTASTDEISCDGHGFETNDTVTFRALDGGTLSAPLAEGTVYYAIRVDNATFKVAATSGGAAINLTTNGVSMVVMRDPNYDEMIEFYSRWVDGFFPANRVPFTSPIPVLVRGIVADLAAKRLLNIAGQDSAILTAELAAAKAQLDRYLTNGMPVRDATAGASTNLAITNANLAADPRGWGSRMLP